MRVTESTEYFEKRNSIAYEYINFFEQIGYVVILIPNNTNNMDKYFKQHIDLVVLTGGNNINPELYLDHSHLEDIYDERDDCEIKMIGLSIENKIPILGICRGFHLLNIYFGGKLSHNMKNHVNIYHTLESKSKLIDGQKVNSFHNQAIIKEGLSRKLEVLAVTSDNTIESFIEREKMILGLQWHPERMNNVCNEKLIKDFLK